MRNFGRSIGSKGWMGTSSQWSSVRGPAIVAAWQQVAAILAQPALFLFAESVSGLIMNSQPGTGAEKGNLTV